MVDETDPTQETDNIPSEEDAFAIELANLNALLQPLTDDANLDLYVYYLLLLWASFQIFQIDPPPDSGGKGGGAIFISLSNGWVVYDYGHYLTVSPGENYRSYCTGKIIEAAIEMVRILAKRGAVRVGFMGHEIAQRAAWVESLDYGLEVVNFEPTDADWLRCEKIRELRAKVRAGAPLVESERRPF